jgi:hypothetical protein
LIETDEESPLRPLNSIGLERGRITVRSNSRTQIWRGYYEDSSDRARHYHCGSVISLARISQNFKCLGPGTGANYPYSSFFRFRYSLSIEIEILALHQRLGVYKRKHSRPRLRMRDRMLWILLRRLRPKWNNVLVIVKPETVVSRHRAG